MKLEQLLEEDWDEIAAPQELCIIKMNPEKFESNFGVTPIQYNDDGLGSCKAFIFSIGKSKYWTRTHYEYEEHWNFINVAVRSIEEDSRIALERLLEATNLKIEELDWVNEEIGPAKWILSRLDDNGNEFEMQRFLNEISAEGIRRKYESKGHKQSYSVRHET